MNSFIQTFRRYRERQQAVRQLSAMPDYLLHDIGIERANIKALVSGLQAGRAMADFGSKKVSQPRPPRDLALHHG